MSRFSIYRLSQCFFADYTWKHLVTDPEISSSRIKIGKNINVYPIISSWKVERFGNAISNAIVKLSIERDKKETD